MGEATIGILHPGEMGAAIGQCLVTSGHEVLWVPQGRSPATTERAGTAGLTEAGDLPELVRRADVIMSVCPPHGALEIARQVGGSGFGGLYLDANAIAPATAREVAGIVEGGGASYVDGGIIGTPPVTPGFIRLYLSGPRAGELRELFENTPVDARVVDQPMAAGAGAGVGAASAVKMAYASWTKGSAAMLLAARAMARAQGVEDVLLAEWGLSQGDLQARSARAARSAGAKGWRWVAEMEEIAASMAAAGLPEGFHQAAAEIYRRAPHDAEASLNAVLDALPGDKEVPGW
jgi:3-hydroxyisobutyrate dehydrogenase-like beta-hydroxyacid dehydrogenase